MMWLIYDDGCLKHMKAAIFNDIIVNEQQQHIILELEHKNLQNNV